MKTTRLLLATFAYLIIIVLTGCSDSSTTTTSNPGTKSSGTVADVNSLGFTARSGFGCVSNGDNIYTFGGEGPSSAILNTFEVFDTKANSWSSPVTIGSMTPRKFLAGAFVNNKIYAIGGYENGASNRIEVYDIATSTWSAIQTTGTATPRWALTSAVVGGKIYVIGGYDGTKALNTLEVFDPTTNSWSTPTTSSSMTARQFLSAAVYAGKIYVMGGNDGTSSSTPNNILEIYDPATSSWSKPTTIGSMSARYGLSACILGNFIYAYGGTANEVDYLNTFEVFDPAGNIWSTPSVNGTLIAREHVGSSAANGKLYLIGGWNGNEVPANEVFVQAQ